jgi:TonB family protein
MGCRALALAGALVVSACGSSSALRSAAPAESIAEAPRLINGDDIATLVTAEHPQALRDAGVGGVARFRILVETTGVPIEIRLLDSSGYPAMDEAAARVARELRFSPALNTNGEQVRVWASFPVVFPVP